MTQVNQEKMMAQMSPMQMTRIRIRTPPKMMEKRTKTRKTMRKNQIKMVGLMIPRKIRRRIPKAASQTRKVVNPVAVARAARVVQAAALRAAEGWFCICISTTEEAARVDAAQIH